MISVLESLLISYCLSLLLLFLIGSFFGFGVPFFYFSAILSIAPFLLFLLSIVLFWKYFVCRFLTILSIYCLLCFVFWKLFEIYFTGGIYFGQSSLDRDFLVLVGLICFLVTSVISVKRFSKIDA